MDKRYQVFVSSTFEDLQEERKEVMQALLELDCIPAGMELFPAADEAQWTLIKRVIDDCDYYLVIVGGRYGSVNDEGMSSGGGEIGTDWGERSFNVLWKGNYLYAGSGPFYEADVVAEVAELDAAIWQGIYQVDQADEELETESEFKRIPKAFFTGDA